MIIKYNYNIEIPPKEGATFKATETKTLGIFFK